MGNQTNEVLTVNEVAEYLRMNPMTIYRLAQQGSIPGSKVMGCWRFQRWEVEEAWRKIQEWQPSKILVVDDDPLIGITIKNALEKRHTVVTVENAHDAIGILEGEGFNLIFLDLNLPDLDGLTLFKQIIAAGKSIPVVVITGLTDGALLSQVVDEGAQFVLHKPFTICEVQQMLDFIKT